MKKHGVIVKLKTMFRFIYGFVSPLPVEYDFNFRSSFCLPFGKADDTPSPSLSRPCSRQLRLQPWCLGSGASSTFAQLRLYIPDFMKKSILYWLWPDSGTKIPNIFGVKTGDFFEQRLTIDSTTVIRHWINFPRQHCGQSMMISGEAKEIVTWTVWALQNGTSFQGTRSKP